MRLGHVAFVVGDLDRMVGFYVRNLGFHVSDRGRARGRSLGPEIVFLSFDRRLLHHHLALISTTGAPVPPGRVHHAAFEVDDLAALRRCWASVADDPDTGGLDGPRPTAVFQGDQWSIRLRDPEGNGLEVYAPTPWDVRQPCFVPELDLRLDDGALKVWAERVLQDHEYWPRGSRPAAS